MGILIDLFSKEGLDISNFEMTETMWNKLDYKISEVFLVFLLRRHSRHYKVGIRAIVEVAYFYCVFKYLSIVDLNELDG